MAQLEACVLVDSALNINKILPQTQACRRSYMGISSTKRNYVEEQGTGKKEETICAFTTTAPSTITMIGFGSLMSESSSRTTFPTLTGFRLARIPGYRRLFDHPASVFFNHGIANMESLEIASLSAEYVGPTYPGFIAAVFDVPNDQIITTASSSLSSQTNDGDKNNNEKKSNESFAVVPSMNLLVREAVYDFVQVPFVELDAEESKCNKDEQDSASKMGIMCVRSNDKTYIQRWGQDQFDQFYTRHGISSIWNWSTDSGLRPCAVYLRHCYLATQSLGTQCHNSFLDETFLIDRNTTVRQYLQNNPYVLNVQPPPELAQRYGG